MKTLAPKDIGEYIDSFPEEIRAPLRQIRETIRKAAPDAEEVISYRMPAYKLNGMLVYFAAFKDHISLFATASAREAFPEELSLYKGGKGTIQFPYNNPLPLDLITRIVRFRVAGNMAKIKGRKK
jgi:uncharacterized protein YdhG (YjbR/CyaY superfamily)